MVCEYKMNAIKEQHAMREVYSSNHCNGTHFLRRWNRSVIDGRWRGYAIFCIGITTRISVDTNNPSWQIFGDQKTEMEVLTKMTSKGAWQLDGPLTVAASMKLMV